MAKFIPYEPKLEKIGNLYYIEITIIRKRYYIVSLTNDLEDNVMLIYPKSVYTLEESLEDFNDHIKQIYQK